MDNDQKLRYCFYGTAVEPLFSSVMQRRCNPLPGRSIWDE